MNGRLAYPSFCTYAIIYLWLVIMVTESRELGKITYFYRFISKILKLRNRSTVKHTNSKNSLKSSMCKAYVG